MSIIQSYVSDELSHFVGQGKTEEEQYDILVNKIIKTGWLMHPPHDLTQKSGWEVNFNALMSKNELINPRIVCFCDIPVNNLSIHMAKYSRFGLTFRKSFLIEKGANPVRYIAQNSTIDGLLSVKTTRAAFYDQKTGNLLRSLLELSESLKPKNPETPITSQTAPLAMDLHFIFFYLIEEFLSFIKFFDDSKREDDSENYYMEREWRVMSHINFRMADIYRVILPESYAKRFRQDVPEFKGQITFAE